MTINKATVPQPPLCRQKFRLHGQTWVDDYGGYRNLDDKAVNRYLKQEVEYSTKWFDNHSTLTRKLQHELYARIPNLDESIPERIDDYEYSQRIERDMEYPQHCRRHLQSDNVEVYLDENEWAARWAADSGYFDLATLELSPDHCVAALVIDTDGDERYTIVIVELDDGQIIEQVLDNVAEDIVWSPDGAGYYYVALDDANRPCRVCYHRLNDVVEKDVELLSESDASFYVSIWKTRSRRYLIIDSGSQDSSEVSVLDLHDDHPQLRLIRQREPAIEYSIDHYQDRFLVLTNLNAPHYQLMAVATNAQDYANWQPVIAESKGYDLNDFDCYDDYWLLIEQQQGQEYCRVVDPKTAQGERLTFPNGLHEIELIDRDDPRSPEFLIAYSSLRVAEQIFRITPFADDKTLIKEQQIAGYDPAQYQVSQQSVDVDGVQIPLTLLSKQGNQSGKALLIGYGAYGDSLELDFDRDWISLMDRGAVIAFAHVRGGGEHGQAWHDAGRLLNKENSFNDYIACADYLCSNHIATVGQIIAYGASAGGLLVATAIQRRPDLFCAAVLDVPFLDVVNTLLDRDLPLTEHDWLEFGNPEHREFYDLQSSYSPYECITKQDYPAILIFASGNDTRVAAWEALKYSARLRRSKTDSNPLLLKMDDQSGHAGPSARHAALNETAQMFGFMFDCWGITQ